MPNVVQEGNRFGQGSMMVGGGISIDGCTDIVVVRVNLTTVGYIEQILLQHVLVLNSYSCTTMQHALPELSCENWTFKRWNGQQ
jgi:hypothetical protein